MAGVGNGYHFVDVVLEATGLGFICLLSIVVCQPTELILGFLFAS